MDVITMKVEFSEEAFLPTNSGKFRIFAVKEEISGKEHVVVHNLTAQDQKAIIRVHSSCLTGDAFGSLRCDCQSQLELSLNLISEAKGAIIYLQQEGRGVGLYNKIMAYSKQDQGMNTVEANIALNLPIDNRTYEAVIPILQRFQALKEIDLLTNNPNKINYLQEYLGIKIVRVPLPGVCNAYNKRYLDDKVRKMNYFK